MKRVLELDYTLGEGWLLPWVEGLRAGKAVASTCPRCDSAHFPPLRFCPACNEKTDGWRDLSGAAAILFRIRGADGDFALARFEGAAGSAVVRTEMLPESAESGVLRAVEEGPPVLSLVAETST